MKYLVLILAISVSAQSFAASPVLKPEPDTLTELIVQPKPTKSPTGFINTALWRMRGFVNSFMGGQLTSSDLKFGAVETPLRGTQGIDVINASLVESEASIQELTEKQSKLEEKIQEKLKSKNSDPEKTDKAIARLEKQLSKVNTQLEQELAHVNKVLPRVHEIQGFSKPTSDYLGRRLKILKEMLEGSLGKSLAKAKILPGVAAIIAIGAAAHGESAQASESRSADGTYRPQAQ